MSCVDSKVLGIITARGGSKGLPKKNILLLNDKPLIAWTIELAQKSKYLDRLILSTDCLEIKSVAIQYSCEVPFLRPAELASDYSSSVDVISHALKNLDGYDYFVLLQPTSPLRSLIDIDGCIERCVMMDAPSCVTVCKSDIYPQLMYSIEKDYHMKPLLNDKASTRRQDMGDYYTLNGAVYVVNTEFFKKSKKLIADNTLYFEMPKERSIDIDDEHDFSFAEFLLNKNLVREV